MGIFTWIINWFRSNKVIMKLAIQDIAYRYFQRKPEMKSKVADILGRTLTAINTSTTSAIDFQAILKDNIKLANLTPPEQEFMLSFTTDLSVPVNVYFSKTALSLADQTAAIKEVIGWVNDMTKY